MQKFKVGDKLICKCDDRHGVELYEVVTIIDESNGYITYRSSKGEWCWDSTGAWSDDFELYKENNVELNKTDKYFINVQEYASIHDLPIGVAHYEIQTWLFKQGFEWYVGGNAKEVQYTSSKFLFINFNFYGKLVYNDKIPEEASSKLVIARHEKQVTLEVESIVEAEETIEFNGKHYSKSKLEQALKLIDESN